MEAEFKSTTTDKAERYKEFISYFKLLVSGEDEPVSTLANSAAALREAFGYFWVGFYLVRSCWPQGRLMRGNVELNELKNGELKNGDAACGQANEDELILGPFQGSPACTRIAKGRGVCGTALEQGHSIIVPDVNEFPGHIACSSLSRSEIVIPIFSADQVIGVLDIDSDRLNAFDETDRQNLEIIAAIISQALR